MEYTQKKHKPEKTGNTLSPLFVFIFHSIFFILCISFAIPFF